MKQHKYLKITISLILLIALITAASIFLSYNVLTVRTFSYETDKAVDPVRAVVISDLHEHEFGKDNVKLVEKIREQEPDIILMVGDFVNQDSTESTVVVKLVEQLSKLAPVCYSLGNHEESYMAKTDWKFPKEIEKAGAHFLDKEYVDMDIRGTKLRIGGMFSYAFGADGKDSAAAAPEDVKNFLMDFQDTERLKIMMAHRPDSFIFGDAASVWDVDLVVSGHDHGGQVVVPFAGGVFGGDQGYFPKYVHGMYEKERLHLFVSSGLGSANEPLPRVNNLPEVAVVEIEKSTQT